MRHFRRFELHKGNKELFWEISRHDKELYIRSGKLKKKPGEKDPHPKREELKDFRVAQLEYDKLIQRKLSQGYTEVDKPSLPSDDLKVQAVRLITLDKKHTLSLTEGEVYSLINYMIDQEVVNKRADIIDISKWERRILRRSDYRSIEEIDQFSQDYLTYFDLWRENSHRSRAYSEEEMIPSFKFTDPSYWIITKKECQKIVWAISSKIEKKKSNLKEKGNIASSVFKLRDAWLEFHKNAIESDGYEVVPGNIQLHTIKKGHHLFLDMRDWNEIFSNLQSLEIWDNSEPLYISNECESLYHFIIEQTIEQKGLEEELFALDDGIKHEITSQLLVLSDDINMKYQEMLAEKKPEEDHSEAVLFDHGFKWNATNLKKLHRVIAEMNSDIFDEELFDFHQEQLAGFIEIEDLNQETSEIINEILNDACHLLNHSHQNIHNTTDLLMSIEEEVVTNVVEEDETLQAVIRCLEDLYPNILEYEFSEETKAAEIYTSRPSSLDEELMSDWLHLLPEVKICLNLLKNKVQFDSNFSELLEHFPTAQSLILSYIEEESNYLAFQSDINRARKQALEDSSDEPGKVPSYKLLDLSEPWVITEGEVSTLLGALNQHFDSLPEVLRNFHAFLTLAEKNHGFTILQPETEK